MWFTSRKSCRSEPRWEREIPSPAAVHRRHLDADMGGDVRTPCRAVVAPCSPRKSAGGIPALRRVFRRRAPTVLEECRERPALRETRKGRTKRGSRRKSRRLFRAGTVTSARSAGCFGNGGWRFFREAKPPKALLFPKMAESRDFAGFRLELIRLSRRYCLKDGRKQA